MNAELGQTLLGGRRVCGHDQGSLRLPAAEMSAAIDVQDVARDRRGVGQVHGPVMVVHLQNGSEIRVQHDAITGLA